MIGPGSSRLRLRGFISRCSSLLTSPTRFVPENLKLAVVKLGNLFRGRVLDPQPLAGVDMS